MAEVHPFPGQRREFIGDGDHSALRATWHRESGFIVVSLWRDDTCVGTSHMTPQEAGRLAMLITGGLADLATGSHASRTTPGRPPFRASLSSRSSNLVRRWRANAARSLESLAGTLRNR